MIAYLAVLNNPEDDLRLTRIINNPPRGIGARTVETAQAIARRDGSSLYAVIDNARMYPELERAAAKLAVFTNLMGELSAMLTQLPLDQFYEELILRTGYAACWRRRTRWRTAPGWRMCGSFLPPSTAIWKMRGRSRHWRASWTRSPCIPTWTTTIRTRTAW